jgi:hypothetical protein
MMTNPNVVKWLIQVGRQPNGLKTHLARLVPMAAADPTVAEFKEFVQSVVDGMRDAPQPQ